MSNLQGSASKKIKKKGENYLPNDIFTDILSRLSVKDIFHCRCVCRRWRNLTSEKNQDFLDRHGKHAVPTVLVVHLRIEKRDDIFLLDEWWKIGQKRPVVHRFSDESRLLFSEVGVVASENRLFRGYHIMFSLNGLIVLDRLSSFDFSINFLVFNPTNGEKVVISISCEMLWYDLYGVFFHPVLNEYCTLWSLSLGPGIIDFEPVEYKVLNLGSKPCWKKIRDPMNKNPRIYSIDPVCIGKYLYWVVGVEVDDKYCYYFSSDTHSSLSADIMEFDIITEEIKHMSCPIPVVHIGYNINTNLLNIGDCLSLVQIIRGRDLIDDIKIWTLKDRAKRFWECSNYRINLNLHPTEFHFEATTLKVISVVNGELAIRSDKTLVVYNLKRGTVRILWRKKQTKCITFLSHFMSLASLRNCKPIIYMDDNGEVDKEGSSNFDSVDK